MSLFEALKMNCKGATYLHEKEKEDKLSFTEILGLRIHLAYCSLCRLFFKQLDELEKRTHKLSQSEQTDFPLNAEAKEKMKQAFEQELKK